MKTTILLCSLLFSSLLFSQLQLFENGVEIENGDTVIQIYYGPEMPIILYTDLQVQNLGSEAQQVIVRCDKSGLTEGTEIRMCWAGECYGPLLDVTPDMTIINAGVTNNGFEAKYFPNDIPNTESIVKFTFLDENQPNDSAWVYCRYGMFFSDLFVHELTNHFKVPFVYMDGELSINEEYQLVKLTDQLGREIRNEQMGDTPIVFVILNREGRKTAYRLYTRR